MQACVASRSRAQERRDAERVVPLSFLSNLFPPPFHSLLHFPPHRVSFFLFLSFIPNFILPPFFFFLSLKVNESRRRVESSPDAAAKNLFARNWDNDDDDNNNYMKQSKETILFFQDSKR